MKNIEVCVGLHVDTKVDGRLVRVRVVERVVKQRYIKGLPRNRTVFRVVNERTGRELERSAAALRPVKLRPVSRPTVADAAASHERVEAARAKTEPPTAATARTEPPAYSDPDVALAMGAGRSPRRNATAAEGMAVFGRPLPHKGPSFADSVAALPTVVAPPPRARCGQHIECRYHETGAPKGTRCGSQAFAPARDLKLGEPPVARPSLPGDDCPVHGTLCEGAYCAQRERSRVFAEAMARS